MESIFCPKEGAAFLIVSDQVPFLLYYAHIPAIILSLLFGFFVFFQAKRDIRSGIIFLITLLFSFRSLFDLITWATNDSRLVMIFWSLQILFEFCIYVVSAHLAYVFFKEKALPLLGKIALYTPLIILAGFLPTTYTLTHFVLDEFCEAGEGIIAIQYVYGFEILISIWIVMFSLIQVIRMKDVFMRKQQIFFTIGLLLFLVAFSWGNIAGSITEKWEIALYGQFGMPVFIGLLAYLVVKYRAFNVKLLSSQALTIALILLVGSQLFFIRESRAYILVAMTLILLIIFSRILVLSVQREVQRKEELQVISDRLATANQELRRLDNAKSEFISIASHQLRTPLTAIKGFVSLLLEGAYGKVPREVQDTLNKVYLANSRLMQLVENLLNISRIESGRIQYSFAPTQIEDLVTELVEMFSLAAREKGLALSSDFPKEKIPEINLDAAKIREVLSNLIDNALKYTEQGGILIKVVQNQANIEVVVEDTGMGIDPDDLPHLFKKFERGKQAAHVNVSSTGLGLYVGKNFIEAHGGTITAHSEGVGKGSRFIVSIPFKSKN